MQLAQENDFPSLTFHCWLQHSERWVSRELSAQPSPTKPSAKCKRNRRTDAVAKKDNEKTPPQSKEKAAPDTHDPARQEQEITSGKKQRITKHAPRP